MSAVGRINWKLFQGENGFVWRTHNVSNTWKKSAETEYGKQRRNEDIGSVGLGRGQPAESGEDRMSPCGLKGGGAWVRSP